MIVIADNFNVRNKQYVNAISKRDTATIASMAKQLSDAGAEVINLQCSTDGAGDEENLPMVVEAVAKAVDSDISLDSRNVEAIRKALEFCKEPPLVNYISLTEPDNPEDLLELVSASKSSLVLRASKGSIPASIEAKLQILEDLIEEANASDIPNERLFADPSLVHLGRGMGQDHIMNSHECVRILKNLVEPPINTIAWISNISAGIPKASRSRVNTAFLTYLAGAGLDAAMVDILDPDIRRALYLIKSFRDEVIFSQADMDKRG